MLSRSFMRAMLWIAVLALLGIGIWYLSYGLHPSPPRQTEVSSLTVPTTISWGVRGDVQIRGTQQLDAVTALGYVHGWDHAWTMVLWRQAAQGRLAEWFGSTAVPADRLIRQLGIPRRARKVAASLSEEDMAYLQAYTDGVNAAFSSDDIPLREDFLRMRLDPSPWVVWHTLAIERLFAWLTIPRRDFDADPQFVALADANQSLLSVLRVYGFEHSIAWVKASNAAEPRLYQRIVYGDISLPLFQKFDIALGQGRFIRGIAIPGTPFALSGSTQDAAWSVLPQTRLDFRRIRDSGANSYERISDKDGMEHVARVKPDQPYIWAADIASDSIWAVYWSGLTENTDTGSWRQVLHGVWQPLSLLDGCTLWMQRGESWQILGSPPHVSAVHEGILAGLSPTSTHVADAIRTRPDSSYGELRIEAYSAWARRLAPRLVRAVAGSELSPSVASALDYVKNWDYSYSRSSIAATILDAWLEVLRGPQGSEENFLLVPDSVIEDTIRVLEALSHSTHILEQRFGADQSRWRWERTHPDVRHFPYPTVGSKPWQEPIEWPGRGHVTSVAWNPAPFHSKPRPGAALEIWHSARPWGTILTRGRSADPLAKFDVTLTPDSVSVNELRSEINHTTILAPKSVHRN